MERDIDECVRPSISRAISLFFGSVDVGIDAEQVSNGTKFINPITIDCVNMVTGIRTDELIGRAGETCERVWPLKSRLTHEFLVLLFLKLNKFALQDGQPVLASAACQTRKGCLSRSGKVLDAGTSGRKIEAFGIEVDVREIDFWIKRVSSKVGGMLTRVHQIPHIEILMVVTHISK